jgi:putative membrane protein
MDIRTRDAHPLRGLAAGIAGGLVAGWIMNQYQGLVSKAATALKSRENAPGQPQEQPPKQEQGESEDATMKTANRVARVALHRELSKDEKKKAGPVVHYAFAATVGGLYGMAAEYLPAARLGFGTLFGAVLFAAADEVAVPAFGLSKPPTAYPISSHLFGLSSHLVYGAGTEAVRRVLAA